MKIYTHAEAKAIVIADENKCMIRVNVKSHRGRNGQPGTLYIIGKDGMLWRFRENGSTIKASFNNYGIAADWHIFDLPTGEYSNADK